MNSKKAKALRWMAKQSGAREETDLVAWKSDTTGRNAPDTLRALNQALKRQYKQRRKGS